MGGHARWIAYLHDSDGNRLRITHPDNVEFGYAYDPLDRMSLVHDKGAATGSRDYVVRYWYTDAGARQAAVRGAGSDGFTTITYYDSALRPNAIITDLPAAGADMSIGLAYNPVGQIGWLERSNIAYAWTGAEPLARNYQTDGQNRYLGTSSGGTPMAAYGYDANGNLTSAVTADVSRAFVYDVENRLVAASGGGSASLVYDPLGRLFQVTNAAGVATQLLYDGDDLIAEYDAAGEAAFLLAYPPPPESCVTRLRSQRSRVRASCSSAGRPR